MIDLTKKEYKCMMKYVYRFLKENGYYNAFMDVTMRAFNFNGESHRESICRLCHYEKRVVIKNFFTCIGTLSKDYQKYFFKDLNLLGDMDIKWKQYFMLHRKELYKELEND